MLYPLSYERWGGLLGFSPEAGPRRGRDLNPRTRFSRVNSLAVSPIRPLSHLSPATNLGDRLAARSSPKSLDARGFLPARRRDREDQNTHRDAPARRL